VVARQAGNKQALVAIASSLSQQARHLSPSLAIHAHRQGIGSRSSRAVHAHSSSTSSSSAEEHTHTHAPREREKRRRIRRRRRRSPVEIISAITWSGANLVEEGFSFFSFFAGEGRRLGHMLSGGKRRDQASVSQSVSLDEFDEARQSLW
jgi:hypothetical protein